MSQQIETATLVLLQLERDTILKGQYQNLAQIAQEKEALFSRLHLANPTGPNLFAIKSRVIQNQKLLEAAMQGLEAAKSRLEALAEVRDTLSVYDQHGQMKSVSTSASGLLRKV